MHVRVYYWASEYAQTVHVLKAFAWNEKPLNATHPLSLSALPHIMLQKIKIL